MSSRELIIRAQKGDREAFLELIQGCDRHIMSVVYRFTGDLYDRQDLYQEVFLRSFRSIKKFRFKANFQTWLYRLALNCCIDYMKKNQPTDPLPENRLAEPNWESREKIKAVHRALTRIRGPQRIAFHLHYIEGWDLKEIAELLHCKEGTVKSHLNRARNKIKRDHKVLLWQSNPN